MATSGGFPFDDPNINEVYITVETVQTKDFNKTAEQLSTLLVRKWMEQWTPGTEEAKPIKGGRLLIRVRDKKTAENAKKNGTDFYKLCTLKLAYIDTRYNESNTKHHLRKGSTDRFNR
jgi:hypothetical protein